MIAKDVLSAEKHADEHDGSAKEKDEEVREIKLHEPSVLSNNSHDGRGGGDFYIELI